MDCFRFLLIGLEKDNDSTGLSTEYREDSGTTMTSCCTMWPQNQTRRYKIIFLLFIVSVLIILGVSIGMLIELSKMQPEVSNVPSTWPYVTKLAEIESLMSQEIYDIFLVAGSFGVVSSVIAVLWILCQKLILLKIFVSVCAIFIILDITAIAIRHKLLTKDKTQFDSDELKKALVQDIFDNFKDDVITGNDNRSVAWNEFFMNMRCCGINPVSVGSRGDFEQSYWVRSGVASSQKIPTSCCVNVSTDRYTAPTTCKDNVNRGTYYSEIMMCAMSVYFIFKGTEKFRKYRADKTEKANSIPDNVVCGS
ncbi:hypothetical protein FSP39_022036 [Pinctada imbricata]|uniref:Tetraspanin n=1 Tax=Pinctada imbricata TaxID=66713 RepID=A0AA88YFI9_PINIB|nr:hypothetical protein FSP39_022036 [Pinctada imbricata]